MIRKFFILTTLIVAAAMAYVFSFWNEQPSLDRLSVSLISISVLYALLSVGIEEFFVRRITDSKTRYGLRKTISLVFILLVIVVLLRVWVENPQALLVAYGIVAAGLAVALQDIVKNFAGSLAIFLGGMFRVGNRIEINDVMGDVIDIGLFNTTLLEIRNWIDADQATGRIISVPNGTVLNKPVKNYTKQHHYLWDEITVVVTPESDRNDAMRILLEIGNKRTESFIEKAEQSLSNLERYYYVEGHVLKPNVYIKSDPNGYALTMRYVVDAWQRRSTSSDIWNDTIQAFDKHERIFIAPVSIAYPEYPMPGEEN